MSVIDFRTRRPRPASPRTGEIADIVLATLLVVGVGCVAIVFGAAGAAADSVGRLWRRRGA